MTKLVEVQGVVDHYRPTSSPVDARYVNAYTTSAADAKDVIELHDVSLLRPQLNQQRCDVHVYGTDGHLGDIARRLHCGLSFIMHDAIACIPCTDTVLWL